MAQVCSYPGSLFFSSIAVTVGIHFGNLNLGMKIDIQHKHSTVTLIMLIAFLSGASIMFIKQSFFKIYFM